ncbi:MAG: PAS domain-containing protein [Methanosarcina sp.]
MKEPKNSGFHILENIPWAAHFCEFYQMKEDLKETLVPYFKIGLENSELCIWVTSSLPEVKEAKEMLKEAVPALELHLEKGQMKIINYTDFYSKERNPDPESTLNVLNEIINLPEKNQYKGLRLAQDFYRPGNELSGCFNPDYFNPHYFNNGLDDCLNENLIDYEKWIESLNEKLPIKEFPIKILCAYPLEKCSSADLVEITSKHQFALIKRNGEWKKIENSAKSRLEETKEVEKTLDETQRRYRMLFSNMSEAFLLAEIICDRNGRPYDYRYLEMNPAFELHTGVKREKVAGKTLREVSQNFEPHIIEKLGKVALSGKSAHFEVFIQAVDRYFEIYAFSPEKGRFAAIFRDTTGRKQADEEIIKQAQLLNLSYAAILIRDTLDRITYWNKGAEEIYGYSKEEALGCRPYELLKTEFPQSLEKIFEILYLEGRWTGELVHTRKDGRKITVATRWVLDKDPRGNLVSILEANNDITGIKKAQKAVEVERSRLQAILENIPVAVGETDANGGVMLDNGILDLIWGGEQKISSVSDYKEFKAWWPETGKRVEPEEWPAARALKGEASTATFNVEKFDGSRGTIIVSATPIKDEYGKVVSTIWINQDITEHKRAEQELRKSEMLYRAIARNFPNGTVYVFDKNLRFVIVEGEALGRIGWSREELEGKSVYDLDEATQRIIEPRYRSVLAGQSLIFETAYRNKVMLSQYVPIRNDKGEIFAGLVVGLDITGRKQAEEELRISREQLQHANDLLSGIIESTSDIIAAFNPDFQYIAFNRAYQKNFQFIFGMDIKVGESIVDRLARFPEDRNNAILLLKRALQGETVFVTEEFGSPERSRRLYELLISPIWNSDGRIVGAAHIGRDATNRIKAQEALREIEARRKVTEAVEAERQRLFDVLETLPAMICLLTPDYQVIFANRTFRERFGEPREKPCYECCYGFSKPCDFCEPYKVLQTGKPLHWELNNPDGTVTDAYVFPFTDIDGSPLILEMGTDITERKRTEEFLANLEIARQKEIHHRIKNNLQVISSLLDLQAEKFYNRKYVRNSEVLEAFRESQNRVISVALIHEELHTGGETNKLNFSLYLQKLIAGLLQTYRLGNVEINLNIDLEKNILFDMDTAVPLGMIVNELVSNSLKYAFPRMEKGEIQIKFFSRKASPDLKSESSSENKEKLTEKETEEVPYTLIVSDNGVGIPENLDFENSDTLGLQLVNILVDQLSGTVELKKDKGTEFVIKFNTVEKKVIKTKMKNSKIFKCMFSFLPG